MTNRFRWAAVLLVTALPALTAHAQVYYSPVFNMPLQPAPSPSNGGFYTVLPDGRLWGPNYYLVPPFNPITGFNGTPVGQKIFADVFSQYMKNGSAQIAKANGSGNPKNVGVGTYGMDYSDPKSLSAFDTQKSLGFQPFPAQVQPARPANYPPYANNPGYAYGYGYGYQMPTQPMMASRPAPPQYYQANYQPLYYGTGQIMAAQGQVAPPALPLRRPRPLRLLRRIHATTGGRTVRRRSRSTCPARHQRATTRTCQACPIPATHGPTWSALQHAGAYGDPGYGRLRTGSSQQHARAAESVSTAAIHAQRHGPAEPVSADAHPELYPGLSAFALPELRASALPARLRGGHSRIFHPEGLRSPRDFFMWGTVQEDERLRS